MGPAILLEGPPVPFKLDSYSSVGWAVDAQRIEHDEVRISISLGHGERIELRFQLNKMLNTGVSDPIRKRIIQFIKSPWFPPGHRQNRVF